MAEFIISGPIKVPTTLRDKKGWRKVDIEGFKKKLRDFEQDGDSEEELKALYERGCYIFCLKASKGRIPWYVGKTVGTIKNRIFPGHRKTLNEILNRQKKGTLEIWTVTQEGGSRPPEKMIAEIEKMLIPWAEGKNPDLINEHHKKKSERWSIEGLIPPKRGRTPDTISDFQKMIGMPVKSRA